MNSDEFTTFARDFAGNANILNKFRTGDLNIEAWKLLSNHSFLRVSEDILESMSVLMKNNPTFVNANKVGLSKIIDNLSLAGARCRACSKNGKDLGSSSMKYMHEIFDDLDYAIANYSQTKGFDKLITEMAAHHNKADGGAFVVSYLHKQGNSFVSKVESFEDFYLSGNRFEADIKLFEGGKIKLLEFKSFSESTWKTFGDVSNLNQLKAYIKSGESFEYVANKTKHNKCRGSRARKIC